jgi:hypothetical protein
MQGSVLGHSDMGSTMLPLLQHMCRPGALSCTLVLARDGCAGLAHDGFEMLAAMRVQDLRAMHGRPPHCISTCAAALIDSSSPLACRQHEGVQSPSDGAQITHTACASLTL